MLKIKRNCFRDGHRCVVPCTVSENPYTVFHKPRARSSSSPSSWRSWIMRLRYFRYQLALSPVLFLLSMEIQIGEWQSSWSTGRWFKSPGTILILCHKLWYGFASLAGTKSPDKSPGKILILWFVFAPLLPLNQLHIILQIEMMHLVCLMMF